MSLTVETLSGPSPRIWNVSPAFVLVQEATNFGADGPVLMEIDVQINARDVTTLIFHPHVRKLEGKRAHRTGRAQSKPRDSAATEIDPKNPGKGQVGASTAQRSTTLTEVDMAINQREVEERAALVASLVVEVGLWCVNCWWGLPWVASRLCPPRSVSGPQYLKR